MNIAPMMIGISILLLAIGKAAQVKKLWMHGFLFVNVPLSEILISLGYQQSYKLGYITLKVLEILGLISYIVLLCLSSRILEFEERFVIYLGAPLVLIYLINRYIGVVTGALLAMILSSLTVEDIFRLNKLQGILLGVFVGGFVGLGLIVWSLSPLALSILFVFPYIYILREARDGIIIDEMDRIGVISAGRVGSRITDLINFVEEELETTVRIIAADEKIYLCSKQKLFRLDEGNPDTQAIIRNVSIEELYEV